MSLSFSLILIFLLLVLVITTTWNLVVLKGLQNRQGFNNLKDERYFELKYRIDLITAVFSIAVFFAVFLGYNSVQDVKKNIETDMRTSLDSVSKDLDKSRSDAEEIRGVEEKSRSSFDEITLSLDDKKKQLDKLEKQIRAINSKNILKQNYYVVNYRDNSDREKSTFKIFFKDLKPMSVDRLPKFRTTPAVIVSASEGRRPVIGTITTEWFEIGFVQPDTSPVDVNFLIFESTTSDDNFK
jgi:hypothetical protein